ncbi:hypothetical protein [Microbacterium sp. LWO13-1.2]|uniref:hypothetical protein n=1 Tax=Microbacterium sp. LWO13-1.2 TaxID=3135262 RepID=UPI00313933FB
MDDRVIPARKALDLLSIAARDRGLNAYSSAAGVIVMCASCYPHQPERLEYSARRVRPLTGRTGDARWEDVLHEECDGFVRIRYPRTLRDLRVPILVADAVPALGVEQCCHVEAEALGGWDWRSDLAQRVEHAVAAGGTEWSDEWDRLARAREEMRAREAAERAAFALGQQLPPKLRVQAFASVLKAAGRSVAVEQARVSWECGHSDEEGRWRRVSYVLDPERGMLPAQDTCALHDAEETEPTALIAEYQRVVDMTDEERAGYKPVPERVIGGRGRPFGRNRGGAATPKAEPREEWMVERTRAFFDGHGIPLDLGVQVLFKRAKVIGGAHPPRRAIEAMKKAMKIP